MSEQRAMGMSLGEGEGTGLFDLPRRKEDLWLVPRLWTVAKGAFVAAAVISAGSISPVVLEFGLLGTSAISLTKQLRDRLFRTPAAPEPASIGGTGTRAVALSELEDAIESARGYGATLRRAALLTLSPTYFGIGAAIALGLVGANPLRESAGPWLACLAFTAVPAALRWIQGLREWRALRECRRRLNVLLRSEESDTIIEEV